MDEMKLDDELRRALNVAPSPEFLARVRTRIASEPEPSRWRLAWVMVPVATAAVVVLGVIGLRPPQPEPIAPARALSPPPAVAAAPVVEVAVPSAAPREAQRRDPVPAARRVPEVLISESERRAFESLLAAIEQDTLPARVRAEGEVDESLAPPPVEIDQLTIAPLQLARLE